MSEVKSYRREFLRAKLSSTLLFSDDDYVFKTKTLNISEGGVLLDQMPHLPSNHVIPFMLDIPEIPKLMSLPPEGLKDLHVTQFNRIVLRGKGKTVRRIGETSSVDSVFLKGIGLRFVEPSALFLFYIRKHVDNFSSNIAYLIKLIESSRNDPNSIIKIQSVAKILGYDNSLKLPLLRNFVFQDYKSLEDF